MQGNWDRFQAGPIAVGNQVYIDTEIGSKYGPADGKRAENLPTGTGS